MARAREGPERRHVRARRATNTGTLPKDNFSYDDNFNYIGARWSQIDLDGTKGYEPRYGQYGRRPYSLTVIGLETKDAVNNLLQMLVSGRELCSEMKQVMDEYGSLEFLNPNLCRMDRAMGRDPVIARGSPGRGISALPGKSGGAGTAFGPGLPGLGL